MSTDPFRMSPQFKFLPRLVQLYDSEKQKQKQKIRPAFSGGGNRAETVRQRFTVGLLGGERLPLPLGQRQHIQ